MNEWSEINYILMYCTHSEDKSVIAKRFVNILKAKIYHKMIANNRKSYLSYLNKLVEIYNNTFHRCSIDKKTYLY